MAEPESNGAVTAMGGLGAEMFKDCTIPQQRWLSAYCLNGDAIAASETCGVNHLEAMTWERDDEVFIEALDMARRVVGYYLESLAIGRCSGEEPSDRLIELMLRAMLPEKHNPDYRVVEDESEYDGGFGGGIDVGEPEEENAG